MKKRLKHIVGEKIEKTTDKIIEHTLSSKKIICKTFDFKIWIEPMLAPKQTIPQQKALDLSFNLTPQKWAWHYQEGATPPRREKHILLNFMGAEGF